MGICPIRLADSLYMLSGWQVFMGEFRDEDMCAVFEGCQGLAWNFPIN
jgi:hypothetical protein